MRIVYTLCTVLFSVKAFHFRVSRSQLLVSISSSSASVKLVRHASLNTVKMEKETVPVGETDKTDNIFTSRTTMVDFHASLNTIINHFIIKFNSGNRIKFSRLYYVYSDGLIRPIRSKLEEDMP